MTSMPVTTSSPQKQTQDRGNLRVRFLTALVVGPLVLFLTAAGGPLFLVLCMSFGVLTALEFCAMGEGRQTPGQTWVAVPAVVALILAYAAEQYVIFLGIIAVAALVAWIVELVRGPRDALLGGRVVLTLAAILYAGVPPAFLYALRALPDGLIWVVLMFMLTWGTDTLAYFGGRTWGRHPLAPRISPRKTVEGAVVGVVGGIVCGALWLALSGQFQLILLPLLGLAPLLAVAGDLFESALKRHFAMGDSHVQGLNVLPGHGGVMDRTDAMIWVTTLIYFYVLLVNI
jgi:phosphatidate cytidylyltransferase